MIWAMLSVLAALMWAVVNTVDKYLLTKYLKNPVIPTLFFGVISLFSAVAVYIIQGVQSLPAEGIVLALIAGMCHIAAMFLYLKAVKVEEISRIVPLFHLESLFIAVLAAVFLGEIFTPVKYAGIFLLVAGAMMISYKGKGIRLSRGFWLMILAALMFTATTVMIKYLLAFADYWSIFAYIRFFVGATMLPVFYMNRHAVTDVLRKHGKKPLLMITGNEILNVLALLVFVMAVASGFVTLVDAFQTTQSLFVIVIATALGMFCPKIFKEELGKAIALKLTAVLIMFLGILLLS
ncbi:MAG: DMT family transporter [Candidatus Aenigmatarchaeota archaeon]